MAFEVNHPGGACWGEGTGLKVTPNIVAGDKVVIKIDGEELGDTIAGNAAVTGDAVRVGNTVTVTGKIAAGVNQAQTEQRIINPDLKDTVIGRRDVRALPGPIVPSDKGGYSSGLSFDGDNFTAVYEFLTEDAAILAANAPLGERMMSWQVEDGDGNRQGLTIAEYGELGGPGMGGCPAGPADQGAPTPGTAAVVRSADKTSMTVNWTPATAAPGAEPVSGYSVSAIAKTVASGQQVTLGARTDAAGTRATIAGLSPTEEYTVEVRSLAGPRMSEAFTTSVPGTPAEPGAPGDTTPPTLTSTPAFTDNATPITASSVTLQSDGQIYFTTDGLPAVTGDMPSDTAKLYTAPIPITAQTVLRFAAFDDAGNTATGFSTFTPGAAAPAPAAPAVPVASATAQDRVTLTWPAVTGATGYQVQVLNAAGTPLATQPAAVVNPTQVITGLTRDTEYQFSVKAKNAAGTFGPASPVLKVRTLNLDTITVGATRYRAGDRLEVSGTGSVTGAVITVRSGPNANSPVIPGATAVVLAPVAPATNGAWSIRLRGAAVPAGVPSQIWVTSDKGGKAGPSAVAR